MKIEIVNEQLDEIVISQLNFMLHTYEEAKDSIENGIPANYFVYGNPTADLKIIKKKIKQYKSVISDFTV